MTEREKTHLTWIAGLAIAVLILWWLWYRSHASTATAATDATTIAAPIGGWGQQTPSVLGLPAPQINLAFQNPVSAFTNQPTGYVPLFGFLGFSGQWQ